MKTWHAYANELLRIELNEFQLQAFERYEKELIEWNQKMNLTAIREPRDIQFKHFLDSLTCVRGLDPDNPPTSLIDIGTGAGFPGIPLKILFADMRLCLVESVRKKTAFCEQMVELLEMKNVTVLPERAEEIGQNPLHREGYDVATARAVAAMPTLVEYLLPLVRVGGRVIIQKGKNAESETESSRNAIRLLGGKLREIKSVVLPEVEGERFLIILDKVAPTKAEFPRRTGIPAKAPIKN